MQIQENYLSPEQFENFLVNLKVITNNSYKASFDDLNVCTRIQYGCGLRISEAIGLTPNDFDLDNLILTLNNTKTGFKKCSCAKFKDKKLIEVNPNCIKCNGIGKKRIPQFTTILPSDIPMLREYLSKKRQNKTLFDFNRVTVWRYYKKAGKNAGLSIREQQDERSIEGIWTHLLRKSRAKLMQKLGASNELISLKLRHRFTTTERYTRPDIVTLKQFEQKHFGGLQ